MKNGWKDNLISILALIIMLAILIGFFMLGAIFSAWKVQFGNWLLGN